MHTSPGLSQTLDRLGRIGDKIKLVDDDNVVYLLRENARRYDTGFVPTTAPKRSRITAADPKPASVATRSIAKLSGQVQARSLPGQEGEHIPTASQRRDHSGAMLSGNDLQ